MEKTDLIKWFHEIQIEDVAVVGGKNASLGEMIRELTPKGVKVPDGFAITASAYRHFIDSNQLGEKISAELKSLKSDDIQSLRSCGSRIRQMILHAELPQDLKSEIQSAYQELGKKYFKDPDVAVRSSATAEDLPDASFAGQQETYLNVQGLNSLFDACRKCFASLFTDRAISYREHKNFDHFKLALSIGVQKMVRSDLAASGVMFSIDTESGFKNAVLINSAYGLGENVVQGAVNPDEFYIFKPTLKQEFSPILRKQLGTKEFRMIYDIGGSKMVKNIPVDEQDREKFSITEDEILKLARWACIIEDHYTQKRGTFCPMDMEWAKDGETGELFIVQARPETVQSQKHANEIESYTIKQRSKILARGRSVGEKISSGKVRLIENPSDLQRLEEGDVLVTQKTDPDWEPAMKRASAIVTDRGGRTCHAAIVSRELGLPAIVGTEDGTKLLKDGQEVTVSCAEGDTGFVYEGKLEVEVERTSLKDLKRPQTSILMNIANPDEAFHLAQIPSDGVGLARMEFIINHSIRIHPMALVHYSTLDDSEAKEAISQLTSGYRDKSQYFVDKLAEGVSMISAAFYPRDVIVRMSDFKTNEYAELMGGKAFEPKEGNPMIGFRGASRYYDPRYKEGFALECQAIRKVRQKKGLTNLKIMIPFCRTIDEGKKVLEVLAENGLKQGEEGLEIYMMCEIPSNVILASDFFELFDGYSIGSNDLTQLVLGVDRDSEIISHLFDERNEAVMNMISSVIRAAKRKKKKVGICGQAPSDYPEFAEFLVEEGIDSISLNPDVVLETTRHIVEIEAGTSQAIRERAPQDLPH